MSVRAMLRDHREVWRPSTVDDGMGGRTQTFSPAGTVRCKVDQPSTDEREQGEQWGMAVTHRVYFVPSVDVRRGDELRGKNVSLRVLSVVGPSGPRYVKALCTTTQVEGDAWHG